MTEIWEELTVHSHWAWKNEMKWELNQLLNNDFSQSVMSLLCRRRQVTDKLLNIADIQFCSVAVLCIENRVDLINVDCDNQFMTQKKDLWLLLIKDAWVSSVLLTLKQFVVINIQCVTLLHQSSLNVSSASEYVEEGVLSKTEFLQDVQSEDRYDSVNEIILLRQSDSSVIMNTDAITQSAQFLCAWTELRIFPQFKTELS